MELDNITSWISFFNVTNNHLNGNVTVNISLTDLASNTVTNTNVVTSGSVTINNVYPTITLKNYENTDKVNVSLELGSQYNEAGAEGTHDIDIVSYLDTNVLGAHVITYSSTSNSGNTTTKERTITIVDTKPPTITLNNYGNTGVVDITLERYSTYTEYGGQANEVQGATLHVWNDNVFKHLNIISDLDMNNVGNYKITYEAKDQSGNQDSVVRNVTVVDTIKPIIILNGEDVEIYKINHTYNEKHAKILDNPNGSPETTLDGKIVTIDTSELDMTKKGIYKVYYNLEEDNGGNIADTVVRYVVVGYQEETNVSDTVQDNRIIGDMDDDGELGVMDIWLLTLKVLEHMNKYK
jgi:hypothetical protein